MEKPKPWQIGVIALAVVAAGVSIVLTITRSDAPKISTERYLVDVSTGELFEIDVSKGAFFPALNPQTGRRSLLPVKREGSEWVVESRYLGGLEEDIDQSALDTSNAGPVRANVKSTSPKRLRD